MFGSQYYHGILRKYVIAFGSLFNDIVVQRFDAQGNRIQAIGVPVAYGPKEKFLARLADDPGLDRTVAITLPRVGFEMQQLIYAPTRKLSTVQRMVHKSDTADGNVLKTTWGPVPYDINFLLSIFVKNADDGTQIMEQILPYFRPEWTVQMKLVPEMSIIHDVPVVLQGVTVEDAYEGDFDTRRSLVWNLDFMMKGYLYGPVSKSGTIKRTIIDLYTPPKPAATQNSPAGGFVAANSQSKFTDTELGAMEKGERIVITPAMISNTSGTFPTTNSAASVSTDSINANSNYGYAVDLYGFASNVA
jgi:hypothetical protein